MIHYDPNVYWKSGEQTYVINNTKVGFQNSSHKTSEVLLKITYTWMITSLDNNNYLNQGQV